MINRTKVNTDAAIFQVSNCFSFAFAARNHKDELVEARSGYKPGRLDPVCAEATGIREVLRWIKERQKTDVTVETDCIVAVEAIRSTTQIFFLILAELSINVELFCWSCKTRCNP